MILDHEEIHEPADHPGGEFVVPAEPGVDNYTVFAEGYEPAGGRVTHLAPDDPTQVVRLEVAPPSKEPPPPPALKGRLLKGGQPLAGISWELRHGDLIPRRDSAEQSWSGFSSGYRGKQLLGFFEVPPNPSRTGQTDAEGRFFIPEIELGHLRLDLLVSSDSLPVQRFLEVNRDSGEIDLGDLELVLMASIDGHAVIPERIDATQVNVLLDRGEETSVIVCPLDASGNFRARHLEPGTARIWVEPLYGQLRNTDPRAIELHSGSTATPTIDATDQEYCEIQLHVKTSLEWLEYQPTLQLDADVPEYWYSHLGQHEDGFLSSDVAPFPKLYLMVSYDLRRAVHPDPLELPPGGVVEATRAFEFGALHVELPTQLELPERGYADLSFESILPESQKTMPSCRHELRTRIENHRGSKDAPTWSSELTSTTGSTAHYKVDYLSAGTYTVKLEIYEIAPDQPRRGPITSTSILESTTRAVVRIYEESRARIQ